MEPKEEVHNQYYYANEYYNSRIIEKPKQVNIVFRERIMFEPGSTYDDFFAKKEKIGKCPLNNCKTEDIRNVSIPIDNKYIYIFKAAPNGAVLKEEEVVGKCPVVENVNDDAQSLKIINDNFSKQIINRLCNDKKVVRAILTKKIKEQSKNKSFLRGYLRNYKFQQLSNANGKFGFCKNRNNDKKPSVAYEKEYISIEKGCRHFVLLTNSFLPARRIENIKKQIENGIKNGTLNTKNGYNIDEIKDDKLVADKKYSPKGAKTFLLTDNLSEIEFLHSYFKIYRGTIIGYIAAKYMKYTNRWEEIALDNLVYEIIAKAENIPDEDEKIKKKYIECLIEGDAFFDKYSNEAKWSNNLKSAYETYGNYLAYWLSEANGFERINDNMFYDTEGSKKTIKYVLPSYKFLSEIAAAPAGAEYLLKEYEKYKSHQGKNMVKTGITIAKTANDFSVQLDVISIWAPIIAARERKEAKEVFKKLMKEINTKNDFNIANEIDKFGVDEKTWMILDANTANSLAKVKKVTTKEVRTSLSKNMAQLGGILAVMNFSFQASDLISGKNITNDRALGSTVAMLDMIGAVSTLLKKAGLAEALGPLSAGLDGINCIINISKGKKNGISEYTKLAGCIVLTILPLVKGFLSLSFRTSRMTNIFGWLLIITGMVVEGIEEEEDQMEIWLRHCDIGICRSCVCGENDWEKKKTECNTFRELKSIGKEKDCFPNPAKYDDWTHKEVIKRRLFKIIDFNSSEYEWPHDVSEQLEAFTKLIK